MANLTLPNKNNATLVMQVRHGKNPVLADIQNLTFTDIMFPGEQVKDVTFNEMADQVWTLANKNNATITFPTKS